MNDPKYSAKLCHIDGYIIPDDEPIMVLRGKDVGALVAIVAYIEMLEGEHPNAVINSHLDSAIERLETFYRYQLDNPGLQTVGCSNRNHGLSKHYIAKAYKKLAEWEI
jgi:hypothetical protein